MMAGLSNINPALDCPGRSDKREDESVVEETLKGVK
jgi:hypothetical protein